tara:strand:- start:10317 stop:10538 length:222 start_codon:yes stop_codon:yes gene_type:complete
MIKNFEQFINESEELENFFDDLESSEVKLKLFTKFKSGAKDIENTGGFTMGKPKKKFRPKKTVLRKKNDKGIF